MRRRPGRPHDPVQRPTLLAAAARVFDRCGFAAAPIAEIAREAGISKGALAYHFPTKEALYHALMASILADFGALVGVAATVDAGWLDRLDALGRASVGALGARPEVARLMLRELLDGGPFVSGPGADGFARVLALVVAFLDEGVAAGLAAPQDPRHLAGTIVAAHVAWFGAPTLSGGLVGDPTSAEAIAARERELLAQIRRLCGAPPFARPDQPSR